MNTISFNHTFDPDVSLNWLSYTTEKWQNVMCAVIIPRIHEYNNNIFNEALTECTNVENVLGYCQEKLLKIQDCSITELRRITTLIKSDAPFIEELIQAVFRGLAITLSACRSVTHLNTNTSTISIPKISLQAFLHKCFIDAGIVSATICYLFDTRLTGIQRMKNYAKVESILKYTLNTTILSMLPLEKLLNKQDVIKYPEFQLEKPPSKHVQSTAVITSPNLEDDLSTPLKDSINIQL